MTAGHLILWLTVGPVVLGLVGLLVQANIDALEYKLWPRGLRWFPGAWRGMTEALHRGVLRVFWPEKRAVYKSLTVLRLESLDSQWRTWTGTSEDGVPEWRAQPGTTYGHWAPRPRPHCPCGYGDECGIWCGGGHADGRCPEHETKEEDRP